MLDLQYRMHPSLSRFPSSEFYNFSLHDGTVNLLGQVSPSLLPPASCHLRINPETGHRPSVIFLDHAGNEEMKDRSRVNHNEARIVCAVIEDLLLNNPVSPPTRGLQDIAISKTGSGQTMTGNDIGIIAPYAAQISLLDRLLKSNATYREQLVALLGPLRAMQAAQIEVKTVDGFEGREKEVIVFSTVRNNAAGHIGFLADRRRMNVGLTRAKRGLFVVGSVGTLRTGKGGEGVGGRKGGKEREVWKRYVEWLAQNGAVRSLKGELLQGMLFPSRTLKAYSS
jgi:superfamily I DNA and/or RNA helicase